MDRGEEALEGVVGGVALNFAKVVQVLRSCVVPVLGYFGDVGGGVPKI